MRDACGARDVPDSYQPAWASGYVACCSMDGSTAERNSPRLGGACSDLKTFAQAKAFCAAGGMRLCKPLELSESCGSACGYDSVAVWTSEPGLARAFCCLVCTFGFIGCVRSYRNAKGKENVKNALICPQKIVLKTSD